MSISLQCHNCEKLFKLPDEIAGRKIRCKNCDEILRVPELDAVDYEEEIGDWDFKSYNRDDKADFRESDFKRRSRARNASGKSKKGRVAVDKGRKKAHPLVFWGSLGCGVVMVFACLIGFIAWKFADAFNRGMEEVAKAAEEQRIEQQRLFDEMVLEPYNLSNQGLPLVIDVPDDIDATRADGGTVYLSNEFFFVNIQRPGPKDTIQEKLKDINLSNEEVGELGFQMTYEKLDENTLRIASPDFFDDGKKGYTIYAIVDVANKKYLCQTEFGIGSYTKEQSEIMLKCIRSLRSPGNDPPAGDKQATEKKAIPGVLEKGSFSVELTGFGDDKLAVIEAVLLTTDKNLKQAKQAVESAPQTIAQNISQADAEKIKKQVEAAGGRCVIKAE